MKIIGFVVLFGSLSLSSCSFEEERKLADEQVATQETKAVEDNATIKAASASELDCQFKGCKAHW